MGSSGLDPLDLGIGMKKTENLKDAAGRPPGQKG
jgi:hypothetical protein